VSHAAPPTWSEGNQRHLVAALARVRRALEGAGGAGADDGDEAEIAASMPAPPALHRLRDTFRLSPFECDVLLACAGVELDTAFADALRGTVGAGPPLPTFGLALARLPGAHWSALAPTAPLRHWRLVEVAGGESSARGQLRIDERILHHLTGTGGLDERLQGLVEPVAGPGALPPSHAAEAARWDACRRGRRRPPRSTTWRSASSPRRRRGTTSSAAGEQKETLREIAAHVRQRTRVYEEWGFAAAARAGSASARCSPAPSGTGKTMAAEVLANDLGSTCTASTSARWSASTSARRRRTCAASSTPPRRAAPSCSSTRPTRCSASAAR
jgi:hypothetical protein